MADSTGGKNVHERHNINTDVQLHPSEPLDPQQVIQTAQHQENDLEASNTYPPLPWPFEALSGTIWRHLPNGLSMRIDHIGADDEGLYSIWWQQCWYYSIIKNTLHLQVPIECCF